MSAYPAGAVAQAEFAKLRAYAKQAVGDPASIGVEVWVSIGRRERGKLARGVWKSAAVTHVTLNTTFQRNHHQRISSRSLQAHLDALARYRDAVADFF